MKENDPKANLVSLLANFFVTESIAKICWFGKQAPPLTPISQQKTVTEDCVSQGHLRLGG